VTNLEGLKMLYMHANKILDLAEIDKLSKLKQLSALTMHGNPIENLPSFKHYILFKLPKLKHLNFTGISKADRQTSTFWIRSNAKAPKAIAIEEKSSNLHQKKDETEKD
jgi:Leucine-rich repeat (LRR) protein